MWKFLKSEKPDLMDFFNKCLEETKNIELPKDLQGNI